VKIYGAIVNVLCTSKHEGNFSNVENKILEMMLGNSTENTGFLLSFSSCCFSCIFSHENHRGHPKRTNYFLVACYEMQKINVFEKFTDSKFLVNKISTIVKNKCNRDDMDYNIQFLSCTCSLTKREKQKVSRKHKSSRQKSLVASNCKKNCEYGTC
jgi:hypothetical protein